MTLARSSTISIETLAKAAGLSVATISRALRPETQHLVKADRRAKILEMAVRLGYVSHPGARSLRHKPLLINVLMPPLKDIFSSEYYASFLSGALEACVERNFELRIAVVDVGHSSYLSNLRTVALSGGGLFYLGHTLTEPQFRILEQMGRPLALIENSLPLSVPLDKTTVPVVGIDNFNSTQTLIGHLFHLGHRRIAMANNTPDERDASERLAGFKAFMTKQKLSVPDEYYFEGNYTIDTGYAAWRHFRTLKNRPTAIFCGDDDLAIGCLKGLHEDKLECPRDISIVGFDDIRLVEHLNPPLTTMHLPIKEMAIHGVKMLQALIQGEKLEKPHKIFTPQLVIRRSTRAIGMKIEA